MSEILTIKNLSVTFDDTQNIESDTLKGVNLVLNAGEMLSLVGESGSGKTLLCRTVFDLLGDNAIIRSGEIIGPEKNDMSMVLQDPMTSLNPAFPIGKQIAEAIKNRKSLGKQKTQERVYELLELVGIKDAKRAAFDYPQHFSGGMRQRIAVAIALAMEPKIIFADEPTTSLDADLAESIMELFVSVNKKFGTSILFITHDLALVKNYATRIVIIENGSIIEEGLPSEIFENPKEEYTKRLINYAGYADGTSHTHGKIHFHEGKPHLHDGSGDGHTHKFAHAHNHPAHHTHEHDKAPAHTHKHSHEESNMMKVEVINEDTEKAMPLISIRDISKYYKTGRNKIKTVLEDLSFDILEGETLGLNGKSGIGKSTLARLICKIEKPATGSISYDEALAQNNSIQIIFQDSRSSLNPRMKIREIISEPTYIKTRKTLTPEELSALLARVELSEELLDRHPHEISGGERQRAAIARAISTNPKLIVADEPVSSLDVSVRNTIVHLLKKLKDEDNMTFLLISHDLPLLMHVSDRIITLNDIHSNHEI